MKAIINAKLILEDGIVWDGTVLFDGDRILAADCSDRVQVPENAERINAHGLYAAPGLIDIHNHGSGKDLFALEPLRCCEHFLRHGETTVLPTFYCNLTLDQMLAGADRIRTVRATGAGRIIGGLYMEGPYMNGVGSNRKFIKWQGDIVKDEYAPLVDAVGDLARIWAIDPARENITGFMKYVKGEFPESIFALGHSFATSEQCAKVAKYGVKVQTHHGDSGNPKGRAQGTPGAGCDEYTLCHPEMYAELICDENGIHVVPERIRLLIRTKGVEKVCLITDSMPSEENYVNNEADGIWYGPDLNYDYEGHLAGSRLTLECACRNLMKHTGYGLCHAIRMATINPARLLGIDDEVGSLEAGKKANLILIDDMVHVKKVFLAGELAAEN